MYSDYPNHHFPPHRWNPQINDTQVAHTIEPWKDCCGNDEDCVCVTESDVNRWNTVSAISALSGIDPSSISAYTKIAGSADLWNDNYETVSANSAYWNQVSGLDVLTGLNSAYWEDASNTVCSNSAFWNAAFDNITQTTLNASAIAVLSAAFDKNIKLYFGSTITGDGTQNKPFDVKYYAEYCNLLNKVASAYNQLFNEDGTPNWVKLNADTDQDGINPYLKTLFNAISTKDNDQDIALNKQGELIQWILNHLQAAVENIVYRKIDKPTTPEELKRYNREHTIYYAYNETE